MKRKGRKIIWEPEHIEFIRDNIDNMSFEEMGDILGVSFTTVRLKALELGIHRSTSARRIRWTDEQIAYLRDHYPTETAQDIADVIGCSDCTVNRKARELGIMKAPSFRKSDFQGRYVRRWKNV